MFLSLTTQTCNVTWERRWEFVCVCGCTWKEGECVCALARERERVGEGGRERERERRERVCVCSERETESARERASEPERESERERNGGSAWERESKCARQNLKAHGGQIAGGGLSFRTFWQRSLQHIMISTRKNKAFEWWTKSQESLNCTSFPVKPGGPQRQGR
jgi:hypothetical protein